MKFFVPVPTSRNMSSRTLEISHLATRSRKAPERSRSMRESHSVSREHQGRLVEMHIRVRFR